MKINSRIKDLFPLVTAGSPGVIRIVILLAANHILSVNEMANFSSRFTLASAFVMLCGVGLGSVVIKEISKFSAPVIVLINTKVMFYLLAAFFIAALSCLSYFYQGLWSFFPLTVLVVTLSGYQISRSYLIGIKSFFALLISDVFLSLILLLFLLIIITKNFSDSGLFFYMIAAAYFIAQVFMMTAAFILTKEKNLKGVLSFKNKFSEVILPGFFIGLSNFFSSGINFILPSLFLVTASENMAVLASFSAACFSIISVLPRGVVNNNLSDLASFISKGAIEKSYLLSVKRKVHKIVLAVSPVVFAVVYGYSFFTGLLSGNHLISFLFLFLLMSNFIAGQLSVIESTIIYFCGYEKLSLTANFIAFSLVLSCYGYSILFAKSAFASLFPLVVPLFLTIFCLLRWKIFKVKISGFIVEREKGAALEAV